MQWFIVGIILFVGLAIGSFLNVLVYRTLHGESPFEGRSKCPKCKKKIRWYDNIPAISFLLLTGRCRYCRAKISWRYPTIEILTASLFLWWYLVGFAFFRLTTEPFTFLQPAFWLMVGVVLLIIMVTDWWYGIIPDFAVIILGGLTLLYRGVLTSMGIMQAADFWLSLVSGLGVGVFFLFLILITRGQGMGMGDAKFGLVMGLLLGWPKILVGVWTAFVLGAIYGIMLMAVGKRKWRQTVAFGPFLVLGTVVALLWGEQLVSVFLQML